MRAVIDAAPAAAAGKETAAVATASEIGRAHV